MHGEMISDTTQDPELLLELLKQVITEMGMGEDALASAEGTEVDGDELAGTLEETRASLEQTLEHYRTPTGEPANIGDDPLFLPHDQVVALLQSLLEQRAEEKAGLLTEAPENVRAIDELPLFTDRRFEGEVIGPPAVRLFGRFEKTDIRWVSSMIWHHIRRGGNGKHPFNPEPATATLPERCRLVIVGDWASGLPRARAVADQMREELLDAEKTGVEAHAVHLGDTYYSGLPGEIRDRLLKWWPVHPDEADRFGSWALNGNHEMYSGGYGYFDHLLTDPRFARQAESSWFVLDHPAFRFVCLDTAWDETGLHDKRDDCGLQDPQGQYVGRLAKEGERRMVMFSHHPLFSGDEPDHYLKNKVSTALETGRVHAWFWGHDHVAEAYKEANRVKYPRCVGHGGIPVHKRILPSPKLLWREDSSKWDGIEWWTVFGFAVLDVDGPNITVRYLTENGDESWREELT